MSKSKIVINHFKSELSSSQNKMNLNFKILWILYCNYLLAK